jgi:hypothetical protein
LAFSLSYITCSLRPARAFGQSATRRELIATAAKVPAWLEGRAHSLSRWAHSVAPAGVWQVFGSTAATDMMLALRGALVEPLLVTMPEVVSRMRPEVVVRPRATPLFGLQASRTPVTQPRSSHTRHSDRNSANRNVTEGLARGGREESLDKSQTFASYV